MSNKDASAAPIAGRANTTVPASLYTQAGQRKYLNPVERRRVLAASASIHPSKALFVETLAWTGARVSEVLALTPASFQLDRDIVAIITLKRRRLSVREVPLPPHVMQGLVEQFALKPRQLDPVEASTPLWRWHRVTVWRFLKALMKQTEVTGPSACPRGFRHGFGVGTLQAGVPLNLVQRWLGHARMSTTAIYADAVGAEERIFADRFWRS